MNKVTTTHVRPFFRGVLGVAIVLLTLLVIWTAWDYIEARRLDAAITDVRARGLSVEPPAESSPLPEYADDVARIYQAAGDLIPSKRVSNEWYHAFRSGNPLPPARIAEARAILAESEPVFALTRRARSASIRPWRPNYGRSVPSLNLPVLMSFRTWFLAETRQIDEATESLLDTFDVLRANAGLENQRAGNLKSSVAMSLWGRAMELEVILNRGRPSVTLLRRLESVFSVDPSNEMSVSQWQLETLLSNLSEHRPVDAFVVTQWPGLQPEDVLKAVAPLLSPYLRHRLTRSIRNLADVVDTSRKPWPERLRRLETLARDEPTAVGPGRRSGLPGIFTGALESAQLLAGNVAQGRTARIAVAVEEFRADTGHTPASLAELVPKYLGAVPIDPFNGEPLKYRLGADSYTIYSVGMLGKYDGQDGPAWRPGVVPSRFIARTRVRLQADR